MALRLLKKRKEKKNQNLILICIISFYIIPFIYSIKFHSVRSSSSVLESLGLAHEAQWKTW